MKDEKMKMKYHSFRTDYKPPKKGRQLPINSKFKTNLEELIEEIKSIASGTNLANAKSVPIRTKAKSVP